MGKYYAMYRGENVVLVFDNVQERDDFVLEEQLVHPECVKALYAEVADMIRGKEARYDKGFGCMAILG